MAKLEKKHLEYLKDPIFFQIYINSINERTIYSNNRYESNNKESDSKNNLSLQDNLEAFKILLNHKEESPLTEELIKKVANKVNEHAMYISNDYRTLGDNIKFQDKYPIESSKNIKPKMKELIDKYNKEWIQDDIYEREAKFNVEFIRIHPFEDGNGRTSRLILNYNMLRQGYAPILIPESMREKYFTERNKENIQWIKEMFEEESNKELIYLDNLINKYEEQKQVTTSKKR